MIVIIYATLFTVGLALGWKIITSEQMLFEKVGAWLNEKSDRYKVFDLLVCPFCTTFFAILGLSAAYLFRGYSFSWFSPLHLIFTICFSSIISGFVWSAYLAMNAEKEKDEAATYYYTEAGKRNEQLNEFVPTDVNARVPNKNNGITNY